MRRKESEVRLEDERYCNMLPPVSSKYTSIHLTELNFGTFHTLGTIPFKCVASVLISFSIDSVEAGKDSRAIARNKEADSDEFPKMYIWPLFHRRKPNHWSLVARCFPSNNVSWWSRMSRSHWLEL
uniref:AlNc14C289G10208 protein n=1 Tax=Albugo laibachii Nc14 TaxID=890382 RepID=F0WV63_9STRA|nr:AlNc14C289G10208 [Albugo laibachii Nc14]|eukprot:CCA25302.1 AlNc14C289G10208 [Albugo laibachii Nc14]